MNYKFYDIVVAKEYEQNNNGVTEKRTKWNKVGRAWRSKLNDKMSFEIFLIPNQRYLLMCNENEEKNNDLNLVAPF